MRSRPLRKKRLIVLALSFLSNYFFSPVGYSWVKKLSLIKVYLYVKEITFFKDKEFMGASGWSQLVGELIVIRRNRVSSTMYCLVLSFV